MKKLRKILLVPVVIILCLSLGGCIISEKTQKEIIDTLQKKGYIGAEYTMLGRYSPGAVAVPHVPYYSFLFGNQNNDYIIVQIDNLSDKKEKGYPVTFFSYNGPEEEWTDYNRYDKSKVLSELTARHKRFLLWSWWDISRSDA